MRAQLCRGYYRARSVARKKPFLQLSTGIFELKSMAGYARKMVKWAHVSGGGRKRCKKL
jgi:hypothetical protein